LRRLAPSLVALVFTMTLPAATFDVYLGTYTGATSKGIYRSTFTDITGALTAPALVAEMPAPSFVVLDPTGKNLYAVSESGAKVAAFQRGPNGTLTKLNEPPTQGAAPCHLVIVGHTLLVANYNGGSVIAFNLEADGRLGAQTSFYQHTGHSVDVRQKAPHAHGFAVAPDHTHVFVADLGLDCVKSYVLNSRTGTLEADSTHDATLPPGSGPRHLAFSPDGQRLYCLNEIGNTLADFTYDPAHATLHLGPVLSTLPDDFHGASTTAEVAVHPNGRFVYASNRGHDSLAVFTRASAKDPLKRAEIVSSGGKHPRNFVITPDGHWLLCANRDTDNVVVFAINATSGHLTPTSHAITLSQPVCVALVASP
jgi:6-phosphogluconolactonase